MRDSSFVPPAVRIEHCSPATAAAWARMRQALWPELGDDENRADVARILAARERFVVFVAVDEHAGAVAFAEASVRTDYVNGCDTSPVAFLEGIYVDEAHRRQGIARALVAAVASWGRERGCREFASDALIDNAESHAMHRALGFDETERVVYFRKRIETQP